LCSCCSSVRTETSSYIKGYRDGWRDGYEYHQKKDSCDRIEFQKPDTTKKEPH